MEFLLTTSFSGPWYPGFLADCDAVVGKDSGGVGRLVEHLELHVGLAFPNDPWSYRVEATAGALREFVAANPGVFFARSFGRDERGTAATLLSWRETLLMSGWDGVTNSLPERLRVGLEALGRVAPGRCRSLAERILDVIPAIEKRGTTSVKKVVCVRPLEEEPPLVRRLLATIEAVGATVEVEESVSRDAGLPSKDVLQEKVLHLRGTSPYDTAEALAAWLQDQDLSRVVVITDASRRRDLDEAFRRYHLPSIGSHETNVVGGPQQFLALALMLRFGPLDPQRLLEFLQVHPSPIPRGIGRSLGRVVAGMPGTGSPAWQQAVEKGIDRLAEDEKEADRLRDRLGFWLPDTDLLIATGDALPAEDLVEACDLYAAWANARVTAEDGDVVSALQSSVGFAERLRDLAGLSGRTVYRLLELTELIRAATDSEYVTGERPAEVGSPFVVHDPAAITAACETVVWWNFTDTSVTGEHRRIFSKSEISGMAGQGIDLEWRMQADQNRSRRWKTPFLQADRVICCSYDSIQGEASSPHPVWAELTAGWDAAEKRMITVSPERLLHEDYPSFAVRKQAVTPVPLPRAARSWRMPGLASPFREKESASSLERMAHCPLQHALYYQAKLRGAEGLALVDEALVKGTLSHHVMEAVFSPDTPIPTPDEAQRSAGEMFEVLLKEMAAQYDTPEMDLDRTSLKGAIVRAAGRFSEFLTLNDLLVADSEAFLEADTPVGGIQGYLDFLLQASDGRQAIIDMKFSERGDASYAKRIREGRALQLAVYDQLVPGETPVAYFSLSDGQFISPNPGWLKGVRTIRGSSLEDTWQQLLTTLDYFKTLFDEDRMPATGVTDEGVDYPEIEGGLKLQPRCDYCEYSALCGVQWTERGEDEFERRQRLSRLG